MELVFDITTAMKVRKATMDDLGPLHLYCFASEPIDELEKRLKRDIDKMERGEGYRLVAEMNGYPIGTIAIELDRKNRKVAQITQLIVTGPLRGTATADKLVEVASDLARQAGIDVLQVEINRSDGKLIEKYKSWGFVEKETIILEKSCK